MNPLRGGLSLLYWTWCWNNIRQAIKVKPKSEAIVQRQNVNIIETRIASAWSTDRFEFLETGCIVGIAVNTS